VWARAKVPKRGGETSVKRPSPKKSKAAGKTLWREMKKKSRKRPRSGDSNNAGKK